MERATLETSPQGADTRDLRDPQKLGEALLHERKNYGPGWKLSTVYNRTGWLSIIEPYSSNPSTLEKYGRPQDLPVTPF